MKDKRKEVIENLKDKEKKCLKERIELNYKYPYMDIEF
jgi:hypothetical protein